MVPGFVVEAWHNGEVPAVEDHGAEDELVPDELALGEGVVEFDLIHRHSAIAIEHRTYRNSERHRQTRLNAGDRGWLNLMGYAVDFVHAIWLLSVGFGPGPARSPSDQAFRSLDKMSSV